jgi:DNA polymerase III epsilon subunit family exonuclease
VLESWGMALARKSFQLVPVSDGPCELAQREFAVLDIETTGGKPEDERIIEIAALVLKDGAIMRSFSQLVDPERHIPPFITKLTGINSEMVSSRPHIGEVLPRFLDFAADAVMVAHHSDFDIGFITASARRIGLEFDNEVLCTRKLGKYILPWLPSHSLSTIADFFGIDIRNRHRALGDAEATTKILDIFLRYVQRRGLKTFDELKQLERGQLQLF